MRAPFWRQLCAGVLLSAALCFCSCDSGGSDPASDAAIAADGQPLDHGLDRGQSAADAGPDSQADLRADVAQASTVAVCEPATGDSPFPEQSSFSLRCVPRTAKIDESENFVDFSYYWGGNSNIMTSSFDWGLAIGGSSGWEDGAAGYFTSGDDSTPGWISFQGKTMRPSEGDATLRISTSTHGETGLRCAQLSG